MCHSTDVTLIWWIHRTPARQYGTLAYHEVVSWKSDTSTETAFTLANYMTGNRANETLSHSPVQLRTTTQFLAASVTNYKGTRPRGCIISTASWSEASCYQVSWSRGPDPRRWRCRHKERAPGAVWTDARGSVGGEQCTYSCCGEWRPAVAASAGSP